MKVLYEFCYNNDCNDINRDTVVKQKQRLKTMLMDYYGEKIIILGTQAKCPEVLLNSNILELGKSLQ